MPQIQVLPQVPNFGTLLAQTLSQVGEDVGQGYAKHKETKKVDRITKQLETGNHTAIEEASLVSKLPPEKQKAYDAYLKARAKSGAEQEKLARLSAMFPGVFPRLSGGNQPPQGQPAPMQGQEPQVQQQGQEQNQSPTFDWESLNPEQQAYLSFAEPEFSKLAQNQSKISFDQNLALNKQSEDYFNKTIERGDRAENEIHSLDLAKSGIQEGGYGSQLKGTLSLFPRGKELVEMLDNPQDATVRAANVALITQDPDLRGAGGALTAKVVDFAEGKLTKMGQAQEAQLATINNRLMPSRAYAIKKEVANDLNSKYASKGKGRPADFVSQVDKIAKPLIKQLVQDTFDENQRLYKQWEENSPQGLRNKRRTIAEAKGKLSDLPSKEGYVKLYDPETEEFLYLEDKYANDAVKGGAIIKK